jgi:hypothetical protein
LPAVIQQVWFIAGSRLQGGNGAASFGAVSVGDGNSSRLELFAQRGISPLDRKLSAINASLPGEWPGNAEILIPGSGARSQQELAVSYTTTRPGYAYWNEQGLTLTEYRGDGLGNLRRADGEVDSVSTAVLALTPMASESTMAAAIIGALRSERETRCSGSGTPPAGMMQPRTARSESRRGFGGAPAVGINIA